MKTLLLHPHFPQRIRIIKENPAHHRWTHLTTVYLSVSVCGHKGADQALCPNFRAGIAEDSVVSGGHLNRLYKICRRMDWHSISDALQCGSPEGFWAALDIWINKPHVLNRNLCGSCLLLRTKIQTFSSQDEVIETLKSNSTSFSDAGLLVESLQNLFEGEHSSSSSATSGVHFQICVRDVHPKNLGRYDPQREAVIIDDVSGTASFVPLLKISQDQIQPVQGVPAYRVIFDKVNNRVNLQLGTSPDEAINCTAGGVVCTKDWLSKQFLPKIARWSFHNDLDTEVKSLRLVPLDRYNQRYQEMKSKYGPHLIQNWPESTDPQKFVYEDISIAAYLLTLWEKIREENNLESKQTFVDLGCGNGLLVYLLSREGHMGKGIDLRKRKIWDFYGPGTCLEENAFTPSDSNLFRGYDWLIGNHSDELTPWIPVITARSSYTCSFFVLPCCSFDFDSKFKEKEHGKSQYRCYLDYIEHVGQECGFIVEEDTLRIPSTKRICFIGRSRTYGSEEEAEIDANRCRLIESRSSSRIPQIEQAEGDFTSSTAEWIDNFKARNKEERPRNCSLVERAVVKGVVDRVFHEVLEEDRDKSILTEDGRTWHTGGKVPLSQVVKLFDSEVLKKLKNECGGLQTLLRNEYHIFRASAGCVEIRDMGEADEEHWRRKQKQRGKSRSAEDTRKTKLCYLHSSHPDGCPKTGDNCRFAHGEADLRTVVKNKISSLELT